MISKGRPSDRPSGSSHDPRSESRRSGRPAHPGLGDQGNKGKNLRSPDRQATQIGAAGLLDRERASAAHHWYRSSLALFFNYLRLSANE